MGLSLGRLTVLENRSGQEVEVRQCLTADDDGTSLPITVVNPNSRKMILATRYYRDSMDSGLPRAIKIYWNNVCCGILTPEDFMIHIKFIFRSPNDGQLLITKIRASSQHQFYIKPLACFHGDLSGRRPMEEEPTSESVEVRQTIIPSSVTFHQKS